MIIDIDKQAIPYQFDIELANEIFTFEINYNGRFDFFTVDLSKDDELLISGERIVYARPLFSTFTDTRLPKVLIIPMDESGQPVERITWDNFGSTVVLLVGEIDE